ncbi:MAG: DNA recombination protein RmuC [Acidobacteriaceae bacterium]
MSSPLILLLSLLAGLAAGAVLTTLLQRGRLLAERTAGRSEAEIQWKPQLDVLHERLAAREEQLRGLGSQIQAQSNDLNLAREQSSSLQAQLASLRTELQKEQQAAQEKLDAFKQAEQTFREAFQSLSSDALRKNNQSFLELAREVMAKQQQSATAELDKKQTAVDELLKPIRETLQKLETGTRELENKREGAYANVLSEIQNIQKTHESLRKETTQLVQALRAPKVRGNWGELQLRLCIEFAGMLSHCSFELEKSVRTDTDELQRPDCIVKLPNDRSIIIDAKTPLGAFLEAAEAPDEATRHEKLVAHAAQVRSHLDSLENKAYWKQFKDSPDFVVCFLPSEVLFSAALEQDPSLIEYGSGHVILATPTTLIALLKAVAYGWQQTEITRNAAIIKEAGTALYEKMITLQKHFKNLGAALENSIKHYNSVIGTVEGKGSVFFQARKLRGHEIGEAEIPELPQLETVPRLLQAEDWTNSEE